jgi:hypothetical protein
VSKQKRLGRPPTEAKKRVFRVSGYLTEDDGLMVTEIAEKLGFKSTSEMITAILERLCIGGFSGMVFVKLGWLFAKQMESKNATKGFYFGVRPLPPLIGDEQDPSGAQIVPFIKELESEARKEKSA